MDETQNQSQPMNQDMQSNQPANAQVTKDIQDFHNLHPNRKLMVFGLILFLFVIAVVGGIMLAQRGSDTTQTDTTNQQQTQNTEVADGQTALSLSASAESVAVGDSVTVTVMLENTPVQATDVAVTYDPTVFEASDIVNGNVYGDILRSEINDGEVLVSAAVSPSNPQDLRTGELFSFTLTALAAGDGTVSFDDVITITALNGTNTLGAANGVTIAVQ